jgi:hypothetical protein
MRGAIPPLPQSVFMAWCLVKPRITLPCILVYLTMICRRVYNKEDEMDGSCSTHGKGEKCIQNLVGKPEGKRQLGRLR